MENRNEVQYAGFFTRLLATLVDIVVVLFLVYIIDLVIDNKSIQNIFFMFAIWWIYTSVMLMKWRATIGGRIFGIEILSTSLDPLSFKWVSLRFLVSVIPFLLYLYVRNMQYGMIPSPSPTVQQLPQLLFFLPPLVMFLMKKKQMVHDLLVQSIVIDVSKKKHMDKVSQGNIVYFGQKVLRIGGTLIFLVVVGYLLVYVSVFYSLGKSSHDAYNTSFHKQYSTNDYNDSKIIFYNSELEKNSQKFVDGEGMYDIFEADVKKDLALNCIQYFLKKHNETNWIDAGSGFRKNARNKYADTEEKINKAKKNEDYTGRHFYTFDLNMVNHIEDDLTKMWSDKNDSVCEQKLPIDDIYKIFVERYTWQFPSSVCYDKRGKKWFELFQQKQPKLTEKERLEKLQREEEDRIYVEKMEREEKNQKIIEKQNDLWKSAKNGSIYNLSYFKNVNANIRNEKGETPLMVAVKNGHDIVVDMMSETIVDVWGKDKKGETAFDYIKKPNSMMGQRMYGSLRILEVQQLLKGKARIVHSGYRNKTDILKIFISGASCLDFKFPKNTQCKSR